ncbi:metacaspase [Coprinopsis cinerea okayama7|uniref:Metacaspase n=1 Tax=Coprinopsis cinerea (strain Okayama-7 / 130 / ATCC MYA-4618 / FGSC 9003) TaxID=240176 RepID=A8N448_COPC7|nr:metacaspase [Coprinopsis cinerea okayama7\|eukprot:XP_001829643.2 metacaspase [Coprinopsis cinerea okayama7\
MFGLFKDRDEERQQQQYQQNEPRWEYSRCTGKKKAVLIGINYYGQDGELSGCINDVQNLYEFLTTRRGYNPGDIVTLTDDQDHPRRIPTKENILTPGSQIAAANWLVADAAPDDALFFHFSGHGTHVKDHDGDEHDGRDEAICPVDFDSAGLIVDDQLHDLLVKPLPVGCRMTVLFDSCHSGSALDLPYMYSTEGKIKEPNRLADAGQSLLSAAQSYAAGDMGGLFRSAQTLFSVATGQNDEAHQLTKETRTSEADVIFLSGCKDEQTSADTVEGGEATGAMSFAFISVLTEKPQLTYKELLVNVREILRNKYSQKPQLSASHPIDTDLPFVC